MRLPVHALQLLGDLLRPVGRGVVDDDDLPVEIAGEGRGELVGRFVPGGGGHGEAGMMKRVCLLLVEGPCQKPGYDGQVPAFVVGG